MRVGRHRVHYQTLREMGAIPHTFALSSRNQGRKRTESGGGAPRARAGEPREGPRRSPGPVLAGDFSLKTGCWFFSTSLEWGLEMASCHRVGRW